MLMQFYNVLVYSLSPLLADSSKRMALLDVTWPHVQILAPLASIYIAITVRLPRAETIAAIQTWIWSANSSAIPFEPVGSRMS